MEYNTSFDANNCSASKKFSAVSRTLILITIFRRARQISYPEPEKSIPPHLILFLYDPLQ
jgi:hypothetical protein